VVVRDEGIRREYNELDTLWFMAGSLFKVFCCPDNHLSIRVCCTSCSLFHVDFIQQYPFDVPTEAFPFEIFKQAFVAVQSCVVHLQVIC
jgi:hypothetical protein